MYLYLACNLAWLFLWVWSTNPEQGVGDIPFSALTLNVVFDGAARFIIEVGAAAGAIVLLLRSLKKDTLWPWRWTKKRLGNMLCRSALICGGFLAMKVSDWPEWTYLAAWFLFVPMVAFLPEFAVFDEPEDAPFF